MPILWKPFQKIEEKGMILNAFYDGSITQITKPDKDIKKKKLQANILEKHRCKNSQQKTSKLDSTTYEKDYIS